MKKKILLERIAQLERENELLEKQVELWKKLSSAEPYKVPVYPWNPWQPPYDPPTYPSPYVTYTTIC